ncbi:uncharacterized protein LOC118511186 [Anopheles stephensi]|uniref:uncharacterized protein LOC118511186 n=1 Tax=Anopheles stephensi TaxID=30069 RepID=UPI0016587319|nr:uncharacterized protein LOC118511186 [Anopheles stephensi]XP_035909844.1 uncharacterized protein LOC118511186 [Anopheles stephensi]XP_035909845.1 uncharacterized protein LOC118511186 [Anopheles stephensi]XP_035909846.1 uncharacterized protein LOC118511186 [Anopheles stephensi]
MANRIRCFRFETWTGALKGSINGSILCSVLPIHAEALFSHMAGPGPRSCPNRCPEAQKDCIGLRDIQKSSKSLQYNPMGSTTQRYRNTKSVRPLPLQQTTSILYRKLQYFA